MPYRFAQEHQDYSDYASGRVFYAAPGHPAFPVRLVSEVFQRCQALRQKQGLSAPVTLYDPCCGSAYHLSTLAYLHWFEIGTILGSDIDPEILPVAARNLGLLTPAGLEERAGEIAKLLDLYDKPSHMEAAISVKRFAAELKQHHPPHPIQTCVFQADATNRQQMLTGLNGQAIDLVLADIPYDQQSHWQSPNETPGASLLEPMLAALLTILTSHSVVAISSDKGQKCLAPGYQRVGSFQIGKRLVRLLQPG